MAINGTANRLVLLIRFFILTLLFTASTFSRAQAQNQCDKELTEAEAKLQVGRLNEAIAQAKNCLEKSVLDTVEHTRAYKILGKAYYAKGLLDAAKENFRKLLGLIPEWRPDPEKDSPSFQIMVEEVIQEMKNEKQAQQQPAPAAPDVEKPDDKPATVPSPRKSGSRKWLLIGGGGTVAAGAAAFLIFRGEEKVSRLPDPPALPIK